MSQRGYSVVVGQACMRGDVVEYMVHGSQRDVEADWHGLLICQARTLECEDPCLVQYSRDGVHVVGVHTGNRIVYKNHDGSDAEAWARVFMTLNQFHTLASPFSLSAPSYLMYTSLDGCFVLVHTSTPSSSYFVHGAQRVLSTDLNWYGEIIPLSYDADGSVGLIQLSTRFDSYAFGVLSPDGVVFKNLDGSTREKWTRTHISHAQLATIRKRPRTLMTVMLVYILLYIGTVALEFLKQMWRKLRAAY